MQNWSNARNTWLMVILVLLPMIVLLACSETPEADSEELSVQMDEMGVKNGHYFFAPDAIMPAGIELIKPGMTGDEVLRILNPRYRHIDLDFRPPEEPGVDYFTYADGGQTKYIEVNYSPVVVVYVRYGFPKPMPIY